MDSILLADADLGALGYRLSPDGLLIFNRRVIVDKRMHYGSRTLGLTKLSL